MIRKLVGLFTVSALVAATTYGCSSEAPVTEVDGGDSGAKTDGKTDGSSSTDTGTTTEDTGTTSSCKPADVSGFTGGAYKPARSMKACTAKQVTDWVTCIKGGRADKAACESYAGTQAAPSDCAKCAEGKLSDATWGFIVADLFTTINLNGCIELKGGKTPASQACASARQDTLDCLIEACDANCPRPDDTNDPEYEAASNAFSACVDAASKKGCKATADKATTACQTTLAVDAAGIQDLVDVCFGPDGDETTDQAFARYGKMLSTFCGDRKSVV